MYREIEPFNEYPKFEKCSVNDYRKNIHIKGKIYETVR